MNSKHSLLTVFFLIFVFTSAVSCGRKEKDPASICPFAEVYWDDTSDDILQREGSDYSTYDSVYGGTCYTFPKEYEGCRGTVKYMFDGEGRLMCAAFAYGCESEDELLALYESIHTFVNDTYGESGYSANHPGNYGDVWYLESGDIVLTTMLTSENKALQYAYLHPLVSNQTQKQDTPPHTN